jgi:hypothetical protein
MTHKDLKEKIDAMEKKYDYEFKIVFDAINQLLKPPDVEGTSYDFLFPE